MNLFCGLPNETASIIVGILHIIFGTILCAAYGTALKCVWHGGISGDELLARDQVEQDFISSLGVRDTSVQFARTFVVAFLCLSATKIIQGIFLLVAIYKSSWISVQIWMVFQMCCFICRITVFILLFTLGNCKPAIIVVHCLTFAVECFCVLLVAMYIRDLGKCRHRKMQELKYYVRK